MFGIGGKDSNMLGMCKGVKEEMEPSMGGCCGLSVGQNEPSIPFHQCQFLTLGSARLPGCMLAPPVCNQTAERCFSFSSGATSSSARGAQPRHLPRGSAGFFSLHLPFLLFLPRTATTYRLPDELFHFSDSHLSSGDLPCFMWGSSSQMCWFLPRQSRGKIRSVIHRQLWLSLLIFDCQFCHWWMCCTRSVCALQYSQKCKHLISHSLFMKHKMHMHTLTHIHLWRHHFSFLAEWLMCLWAHTNSRVVNSCHCSFLQPLTLQLRGWVSPPW